jgi:hypothetical protein
MIALNALTRLTAIPCQAKDIQEASPLPLESGNLFFMSPIGIINRVAITGILISWDGATGMLDDGTGQVIFRTTEQNHSVDQANITNIGSIIFIVARLRAIGIEKYLSLETINILHDPYWLTYRKFETALFREAVKETHMPEQPLSPSHLPTKEQDEGEDIKPEGNSILDAIRLLDNGDGADMELILKKIKSEDESIIQNLIKKGEIYEHKPGKIKVLE